MEKFRLRDYLPVLIMVLCAAIFGVLLATGGMDLDTVPQLVADRPVLAVLDRHPKIKRYFSATQEYGFAMCFAIHMLGLNMEVLGLLLGMLRVDYLTYLAGSWLAIAPGMVCLVIAGNSLDFSSPVFWIFLGINTVLVVCSVVYTLRKLRAAKAKGAEREE